MPLMSNTKRFIVSCFHRYNKLKIVFIIRSYEQLSAIFRETPVKKYSLIDGLRVNWPLFIA